MKPKSYSFQVKESQVGRNLQDFLCEVLPEALGIALSKSKVRKLIFAGAVYVDGSRIQNAGLILKSKSDVKAFVDLPKLQLDRTAKKIEISERDICHEDEEIVVVNKPAGIPTQATVDDNRDHLYAAVQRYLKNKFGENSYCGLHHRLDYDTSGLILFTKKKSANFWVSELFKNRKISKTYHAVTKKGQRPLNDTWEIKDHLARAKNKSGGRVIHMEEVNAGGDFAHTKFRVLKDLANSLQLVECSPLTGRTHQIRIHLKISKQPILGDVLYGGSKAPRIFLHAKTLEFVHGRTGKSIRIDSMYPNEMDALIVTN